MPHCSLFVIVSARGPRLSESTSRNGARVYSRLAMGKSTTAHKAVGKSFAAAAARDGRRIGQYRVRSASSWSAQTGKISSRCALCPVPGRRAQLLLRFGYGLKAADGGWRYAQGLRCGGRPKELPPTSHTRMRRPAIRRRMLDRSRAGEV